jgi:hypothetical protein
LYFSCTNYQELVVGYFTTNPTKLVLHFSDFSVIFYAIYKNQEITFTIGVHLFAAGTLERSFVLQCGPGRGWPARGGQIPGSRRRAWPGKGGGRDLGWLGTGLVWIWE